ncbi:MAG TPA: hypothetical protein VF892_03010, partial [Pseudonocardiaceae bacterium]
TAACLLTPTALTNGAAMILPTVGGGATAALDTTAACREANHGIGLRLSWDAPGYGDWQINWAGARGRTVDLSEFRDVALSVKPTRGTEVVYLTLKDATGAQSEPTRLPMAQAPPGRWRTITLPVRTFGSVDLSAVRSIDLTWNPGQADGSRLCVDGIGFR